MATLTMVFKLTMEVARTWKKLKSHKLILLVLENKKFINISFQFFYTLGIIPNDWFDDGETSGSILVENDIFKKA